MWRLPQVVVSLRLHRPLWGTFVHDDLTQATGGEEAQWVNAHLRES